MTQPDIVMVEKVDKKVAVIDVAVEHIRKEKHEKLEEYQGLGEDVWREDNSGPPGHQSTWGHDPKAGGAGTASEISVQKNS